MKIAIFFLDFITNIEITTNFENENFVTSVRLIPKYVQ